MASVLHQHLRDLSTAATHYEFALARPGDLQAEWHVHYMAGNAYLTLGYQVMPTETKMKRKAPQENNEECPSEKKKMYGNIWREFPTSF